VTEELQIELESMEEEKDGSDKSLNRHSSLDSVQKLIQRTDTSEITDPKTNESKRSLLYKETAAESDMESDNDLEFHSKVKALQSSSNS
jgi:hypothetical protein